MTQIVAVTVFLLWLILGWIWRDMAKFRRDTNGHLGALRDIFNARDEKRQEKMEALAARLDSLEAQDGQVLAERLRERMKTEKLLRPPNWRATLKAIDEVQNAER